MFLKRSDYGIRTVNVQVPCTAETRETIRNLREEIDRLEREIQSIEDNAVREVLLKDTSLLGLGEIILNTWNSVVYVYVGNDIQRIPHKDYEVR